MAGYAYFELDIYTDPAGLCTVEVELISVDTPVTIPPELGAFCEVTGNSAYSNATLALGSRP